MGFVAAKFYHLPTTFFSKHSFKKKALSRLQLIVIEFDEKSKPYFDNILSIDDNNFCTALIFEKLFKRLNVDIYGYPSSSCRHTFSFPPVSDQ
jgi:hypothetical protein